MHGLARALKEQLDRPDDYGDLSMEERIGLLVDREWTEREGRGLTRRLQLARLRDRTACIEDVDYHHPRGLDRSVLKRLATGEWIKKHQNVIVTGSTGCGKPRVCAQAEGVPRWPLGRLPPRPAPRPGA
jgi:DNA replication protein DnaC